jgi:hypothetical protein
MDGAVIRVMRVTGHDRGPGKATYTCHCGKPADFHLVEVKEEN